MSYHLIYLLMEHKQFQTYVLKIGKKDVDTQLVCTSSGLGDMERTAMICHSLQESGKIGMHVHQLTYSSRQCIKQSGGCRQKYLEHTMLLKKEKKE